MLSTENPPPDLQCPCEISQLKSSNDERDSDDIQHNQLEVDLFKSVLDDNNPLPKFSIRDYVFNTRGKDVKNNWPFSLKNLQLCLKHGVKDVLPPFQSLDSVRNPPIAKCGVEKPEVSDDCTGQKLAEDTKHIDSSGSEEKVFPSTTTSQSCSDINSAPRARNPSLEPGPDYFPGSPSKKQETAAVRAPYKVKSNIQNPTKKCKLILKLKNISEPKPATEDFSVNNSVVSDTMATQVCPVCKTFSSSSNTTLNAHIDQCLSGESSMKWMTNSKAIKHRIKPRKTKMMVDIYETALQCTLEDLDRRNGTNWASNLGLTDQELQTFAEEDDVPCPSVNVEEENQEGPVYIDSNGTKLRILSKLGDLPANGNVPGHLKLGKREKVHKLPSNKKRKLPVEKQKIMKSLPSAQRTSHRHQPEADGGQEKDFPLQAYGDDRMQPVVVCDQMKSDDMGMIKQWVGSKRTGLKKKINSTPEKKSPDKIIRNSVRNNASSVEERDSSSLSPVSCDENPLPPAENNERRANLLSDSHDECLEQLTYQKKAQGFSFQDSDDERNCRVFSKPTALQLRNDNPSPHGSSIDIPNCTENHGLPLRSKKMDADMCSDVNAERHSISSRSMKNAVAPGSKKFSSLKKKLLSVKHSSVHESRKKPGRKHLRFKNSRVHCHLRSEEGKKWSRTENFSREKPVGESAAGLKKWSAKSCVDEARVSKIQKKGDVFIDTSKRDMNDDSEEISAGSENHTLDKNNDSFNVPLGMKNIPENDHAHDEFAYEPTYKIPDESFAAFSKSLDTAFPGLGYPSDVGYAPKQYNKSYEGRCMTEPPLGDEQDGFYEDKVGGNLMTSGSHVMGQGNYFVDVDPIPIPGPPGSFLPSPGRMSSEELQGKSSLTACMMQSSENELEVVDMDSSDSPISASSVVSDSVPTRSNSVSINLPEQSHNETARCDIPEGGIDPVAQRSISIAQTSTVGNFGPHEPKSDSALQDHRFENIPPCRCSRKDGVLLGDSLMNRDLQFLRQQSVTCPPGFVQKKIPDDLMEKPHYFSLRSETHPVKELVPEPGKFVVNSPIACAPLWVSHQSEAKFPVHGDCLSPSPSTSNPVLRLMGKNLMVVNKDENLSPQPWHGGVQPSLVMNHPAARFPVANSLSAGKNQEGMYSFNPTVSRGSSAFFSTPAHSFDFNPYDGFRTPATTIRPTQLSSPHPSTVMFFGGNFVHPFKQQEYESLNRNQVRTTQPDASVAYDIDNVRSPDPNLMRTTTADFSGGVYGKEIIVIDDSPENETTNLGIKRNILRA